MLNSIKIKNFRCFDEIEVEGFKRVNFIVGQNATGKTALLEGITIGLQGHLGVLAKIIGMRGNVKFIKQLDGDIYNSYWAHFFKDEDITQYFSMLTKFDNNDQNFVYCHFDNDKFSFNNDVNNQGDSYTPLVMHSKRNDHNRLSQRALVADDASINLGKLPELITRSTMISANHPFDNENLATLYSKYNIEGDEEVYLKAMQKLFPLIEKFSIDKKSTTSVYVKYKGIKPRIPISQVSFGINKMFALIAMIIYNKNGIVLIDEIENGLHVSILEKFWEVLYDLAIENNVQLFITSHSKECMEKAKKVISEHPDDFAKYNMFSEEGRIFAHRSNGAEFAEDLEAGYDFRR